MWRPGGGASHLTYRRVQGFVDLLPPESATKSAARDDLGPERLAQLAEQQESTGYGPWSFTDFKLANLIDKLDWVIYAIYSAQGGRPKKPEPYPRPGVRPGGGRPLTAEDVAYLEGIREVNRLERVRAGVEAPDGPAAGFLSPAAAARLEQLKQNRQPT